MMGMTEKQIQELYLRGENITARLREEDGLERNTTESIETAYDIQAGDYIKAMEDPKYAEYKATFCEQVAEIILSIRAPVDHLSILEAGVGEATTLRGVLENLGCDAESYGFDLSWSRVACARAWLDESDHHMGIDLCTGDLFRMPYADNSVDIVYTAHTLEPNGGREKDALRELYRVARIAVVLLEPGYDFATDDGKQRMESLGYCMHIPEAIAELGCSIEVHEPFPVIWNPLNPTTLTVIAKNADAPKPNDTVVCPRHRTPLHEINDGLFSPEALSVYPIIGGIPCLRVENAIMASKYVDLSEDQEDSRAATLARKA